MQKTTVSILSTLKSKSKFVINSSQLHSIKGGMGGDNDCDGTVDEETE